MLTNDSCTLFLKNGTGFDRYYVPRCHWQENKASNVLKSGLVNADSVVVYVFTSDIDAELKEVLSTRKTAAQDLIIKGECNVAFDGSTPQNASQSIKTLNAEFDVHTVMSIDKLLHGSENMQHFKLSARRFYAN